MDINKIFRIPRSPHETWFKPPEHNTREASIPLHLFKFTTQALKILQKMNTTSTFLLGQKPEELKNSKLQFWLQCCGDTAKGLKTKAELVKRVYDCKQSGKGKQVKQKQGTSWEFVKYSLALPLAPFQGRYLGLIKYHKSRVLLYVAPTACMMMQLVRHSSLELIIRSGDVHLNPGPETRSYNTLFGELCSVTLLSCRFVSIGHSKVGGLLRHLPEVKIPSEQSKLDILAISETHLTENVLSNEVFISEYQQLLSNHCGKAGGGVVNYYRITWTVSGSPSTTCLALKPTGLK